MRARVRVCGFFVGLATIVAASMALAQGDAPKPGTIPPAEAGAATTTAPAASLTKKEPTSPTPFFRSNFCAAVVIHPGRILKSPLLANVPVDMFLDQAMKAPAGAAPVPVPAEIDTQKTVQRFDPRKITRVVVLLDPTPSGDSPVTPSIIVQFAEPVGEQLFAEIWKDAQPAEFDGAKYFTSKAAGGGLVTLAGYAASSRMVLLAPEATLKKMLTPSTEPCPLLAQLRRTKLDHDLIVEVNLPPVLALLKKKPDALPPPVAMFAEGMKSASLTVDLSGDTLAELRLGCASAEAASQLAAMATMAVGELKKQGGEAPKDAPPAAAQALKAVSDQLLNGLKVASSEADVSVTLKMPEKLEELAGQIIQGVMGSMSPGGMPGPKPSAPPKP